MKPSPIPPSVSLAKGNRAIILAIAYPVLIAITIMERARAYMQTIT